MMAEDLNLTKVQAELTVRLRGWITTLLDLGLYVTQKTSELLYFNFATLSLAKHDV